MTTKQLDLPSASIVETLVFYDGPQLVLLKDESDYVILGIAVEKEGMEYPLFCAAALQRNFTNYMIGKVDLRFVFKATPARRLYFTELPNGSNTCALRRATAKDLTDESLFPEPGIFSSVHTHLMKDQSYYEDDRQKFLIDGTWEARDFSRFHGRMADTYSLLHIAQRLDRKDITADEISYLRSSISEKPWQGGGSYLSFYGGIKDKMALMHPLRVAGIEYHSTGYVDLAGNRQILTDIIKSIDLLISDYKNLLKTYRAIYNALKKEGALGVGNDKIVTEVAASAYLQKLSNGLAGRLGLPNTDYLLEACENNAVVYSKLVLSYFRRVKGLADFYIQGRVRTGQSG